MLKRNRTNDKRRYYMSDYSKGKIYRLQCEDGCFYIGSTIRLLRQRFAKHKSDSKNQLDRPLYKHINDSGGWDGVAIELIEEYACETNEQLRLKENEHIRSHIGNDLCLNDRFSRLTKEEIKQDAQERSKLYNETHKEENSKYQKAYHEKNKEKRLEKGKRYYAANKDRMNEASRKHYNDHKEERKKWQREYNARKRAEKELSQDVTIQVAPE